MTLALGSYYFNTQKEVFSWKIRLKTVKKIRIKGLQEELIGVIAHVDAGKTTLSEALLYLSGSIRKAGRVDNRDAFLDNYVLERERGITIFSKQARFRWKDLAVTLVDTPGHVDFSAEMERTLQVLDAAVLVISGSDGIQGHTRTLWYLLKRYGIPTFLFVNKMDQPGCDKAALLAELKAGLGEGCVDFSAGEDLGFMRKSPHVQSIRRRRWRTFWKQGGWRKKRFGS